MRFGGLDGALHSVMAMDVGKDKLVLTAPLLGDHEYILSTGLVIQDLDIYGVPTRFEAAHDGVVELDAVLVLTGLEGGVQDGVGVTVEGDYYVLVATACTDQEAACAIGVDFVYGLHTDVEIIGLNLKEEGGGRRDGCGDWKLGRAYTLASFLKVDFDSLVCGWEIIGDVGVS